MPRAFDAAAFERSLIEFTAVVRADVFDREKRSVALAKQHRLAVEYNALRRAVRDVRKTCNGFRCSSHVGGFAKRLTALCELRLLSRLGGRVGTKPPAMAGNVDVENLPAGARIELFVSPYCPYCAAAIAHYDAVGMPYESHDAQNDLAVRERMLAYTSADATVPTIVVDGKYVSSGWGRPPRG